ncbi:MAG: hypothetical protein IIY49_10055 [Eubacterium sp.]|nr:hypothetical protein [Eubacterium sp.]
MPIIDFSDNINIARKYVEEEGHPLNILTEENKKLEILCMNMIQVLCEGEMSYVTEVFNRGDIDIIRKHYQVKNDYIYIPLKEKYGVIGPADFMSVDDKEVLSLYHELVKEEKRDDEWFGKVLIFAERVVKIINKEKNILFSAVVRNFNEDDYQRLLQGIKSA